MKYCTIFLALITFGTSCSPEVNKELPKDGLYFLYRPIKEIYDSNDVLQRYEFIEKRLFPEERDTLIKILESFNWNYKLTTDDEVLISIRSMPNLDNLNGLQSELEKRMKK